jgi:uncharacterized protein (DUF58 family)
VRWPAARSNAAAAPQDANGRSDGPRAPLAPAGAHNHDDGRGRAAVPREVLRQVRLIELRTKSLVNTLFGGEYNSVFRGQGMEFSDVRAYQHGDDSRSIDWNVTARVGEPFIKKHVEERELSVLVAVDLSGSGQFGTHTRFKAELAAEMAAVLALSAVRNNDRVGLILFTDRIEHVVPPRKGRRHVLRIIRDVLAFEPAGRGTDIGAALDYGARLMRHRGIFFVISDFMSPRGTPGGEPPWEKSMRLVSRRHDVVAVSVTDPSEEHLPQVGLLVVRDPETGTDVVIDTGRAAVRSMYDMIVAHERERARRVFRRLGVDEVAARTDAGYVRPLLAFFRRRERRRRR